MNDGFIKDLAECINQYSRENGSDTPDFILAEFLDGCLQAWNIAIAQRDLWEGSRSEGIKVKRLRPTAQLPTRSFTSAGYDLYASEGIECLPGKVTPVPTGIATEIPPGHAGLIWDRSGMGKKGLTVFGGVVDEDYRGEWFVMLYNSTTEPYQVTPGDRIGQFLVQAIRQDEIVEVDDLTETFRGEAGFGSTGR